MNDLLHRYIRQKVGGAVLNSENLNKTITFQLFNLSNNSRPKPLFSLPSRTNSTNRTSQK